MIYQSEGRNPIRVSISEFKDKKYLDIRKFYLPEGKTELAPTQKGIMLSKAQFMEIFKVLTEQHENILKELGE